jgi:enterochelin esterase-like enzyme
MELYSRSWGLTNDLRFTYLISENDPRLPFADPLDWAKFKVSPVLDPFNSKKFVYPKDEEISDDEAIEMSLVELPEAYKESFNNRKENTPAGKLEKHKLASRILGNERRIWVYTPPGYSTQKVYPTVILLDGWDYLNPIPTPAILDNLQFVAERKLPLRFYLEIGKLEVFPSTRIGRPINLHATRHLRDLLRTKGNTVFYSEFNGAHAHINWRENLAGALQKLLRN